MKIIKYTLIAATFLLVGYNSITVQPLDKVKNGDKTMTVRLATEFIYGSAVRDAAGLFDIKPFTNNNDINNVASEINKIVKTEVVPPFKKGVNLGNSVSFIGAVEMNQEHPQLDNLEVLPIELSISNQ